MNSKKYSYSLEDDSVLIERAQDIQVPVEPIMHDQVTLICFSTGSHRFALDSKVVVQVVDSIDTPSYHKNEKLFRDANQAEVLERLSILDIPQSPTYILGIINLRGKLYTVIDCAKLLFDDTTKKSLHSQLILLSVGEIALCILTAEKAETLITKQNDIRTAVDTLPQHLYNYMHGVVPHRGSFIGLIHIQNLVNHPKLVSLITPVNDTQ